MGGIGDPRWPSLDLPSRVFPPLCNLGGIDFHKVINNFHPIMGMIPRSGVSITTHTNIQLGPEPTVELAFWKVGPFHHHC
jgi:hypothetical protein